MRNCFSMLFDIILEPNTFADDAKLLLLGPTENYGGDI